MYALNGTGRAGEIFYRGQWRPEMGEIVRKACPVPEKQQCRGKGSTKNPNAFTILKVANSGKGKIVGANRKC